MAHLTAVNARTKESGQRGRRVQPATVKKEIATLRGLWNWGKVKGSFPNEGLRYRGDAKQKAKFILDKSEPLI